MHTLPEIAPIPGQTTQELVYTRLRGAIMVGALAPGEVLTIRGIAGLTGLSPTPVREALRRLASEQAIETLGNRRIRIPPMTAARFDEIVRLRVVLETHAARRALGHVSDVLIGQLARIDARMDEFVTAGRLDDLTIANQAFHRMLYTANPEPAAMPLIESVWLQLGPFQRQVLNGLDGFYHEDRHKEVLDALRRRDPDALASAIAADIRDGIGDAGRAVLAGAERR